MDEKALLTVLRDLDSDLAYVLGSLTGARIEDRIRPIVERVQTNASKLAEILRQQP